MIKKKKKVVKHKVGKALKHKLPKVIKKAAKKHVSKSPKAKNKIEKVMHEFKEGALPMGKSGKKVKSRKQAIAIALSEARRAKK